MYHPYRQFGLGQCWPGPVVFYRPSLEHRLANLLIDGDVQSISFRFGHVIILPEDFRKVAEALRDGRLKIKFDPTGLAANGSVAEYHLGTNTFSFQDDKVLETAAGRATAVHEAAHAVGDARVGDAAIRHSEAAAHICEGWYHINTGTEADSTVSQEIMDISRALRNRAATGGRPARATGAEINSGRREMAKLGYENAFYDNSGI